MTAYDLTKEWASQKGKCVLVLGRALVHEQVALTPLRDAGLFVMLLPSHSPDFNIIEEVFSVVSTWLRRYMTLGSTTLGPSHPQTQC